MPEQVKRFASLVIVALAAAGCGGDSGTGPEEARYNNIAGSYSGPLVGSAQGYALQATLSLTISQDGGRLSGSWALTGTLSDGLGSVPVQGTGTLTGTIAPGNNPSVHITVRVGACPSYSASFSGTFDTANRRLTVSGPVDILSSTCTVLLRYQSTIILTR
jgi:hypothetical protein